MCRTHWRQILLLPVPLPSGAVPDRLDKLNWVLQDGLRRSILLEQQGIFGTRIAFGTGLGLTGGWIKGRNRRVEVNQSPLFFAIFNVQQVDTVFCNFTAVW